MRNALSKLWQDERGQDAAEYAMMMVIILLLAGITVKLVGANVRQVFARTNVMDPGPGITKRPADIVQHCEEAVRDQIDGSLRADFPLITPELRVERIDDQDYKVKSFVETRSANGSVVRIDYTCSARCTQMDGCSAVAELRR